MIQFEAWPKTPRLFRDITITEKIDGTNGAIIIRDLGPNDLPFGLNTDDFEVMIFVDERWWGVGAQSRNRLVKPGKSTDNHGFAAWVHDNAAGLVAALGEGRHFGEWWGQGVARNYGLDHKRFSLFNTHRYKALLPHWVMGLDVVPVMYQGPYSEDTIRNSVIALRNGGSWAAPGFRNPEGIITFHSASKQVYKTLLDNDEIPKGVAA